MATKDCTVDVDLKFFELLYPLRYPNKSKEHYSQCRKMVLCGEMQIETLYENTIVNLNPGIEKDSTDGRDFSDGSDAKKVTSSFRNNRLNYGEWTNSFQVRNVGNKLGGLRVLAYNVYLEDFEYYVIPPHAYSHLSSKTVEIPIERYRGYYDCKPNAQGQHQGYSKWYNYQVEDIYELANAVIRI